MEQKMNQEQPITGQRRRGHYTEAFRREVIGAYLSNEVGKCAIWKHYTGENNDHGLILKWMREFGMNERAPKKAKESELVMNENPEERLTDQVKRLKKELAAAEQALEQAELKAQAFSILIDIAEKEFQIPILKKSVAKPSM